MDRDTLVSKLKEIVKPYIQDEAAFEQMNEQTDFINDLKINSANLVDVILDVEEAFDIEIEDDAMEKMLDVKSAIEIILQRIEQ